MDLLSESDDVTVLRPDQESALQVRGTSVFGDYLNRLDETERAFDANGWFANGDLTMIDADRLMANTGRNKEFINGGGVNYNLVEVEEQPAGMQTEFSLGLLGSLQMRRLMDSHENSAKLISLMKRNDCGKALNIAREARDMHCGNGVNHEYRIIQLVMNLEAVNTYEGTHDAHTLIPGRGPSGLQAFQ